MQSRKRVWLLFTAVIIAVFAMVGCIPTITPDKTPPDITASSATFSPTTIDVGDPLTVTVELTAEDERSNLKNAQIVLKMKKPGETSFTEVGASTRDFPENVKTGSLTENFQVAGTHFDVSGDYTFKAEIKVSDVKDNISKDPVEVSPSGSLYVSGQEKEPPVITQPSFSPRVNNAVPQNFMVTAGATDPDGDLVYFEFKILDEETTILEVILNSEEGTTQLSSTRNVSVDLGDAREKTLRYFALARDKEGNTASMDNQELLVRKTEIGFITYEDHIDQEDYPFDEYGKPITGAQSLGNYVGTAQDVVPTETDPVYWLPFGITTLTFEIYPGQSIPTNNAMVYIYSEPEDIFSTQEQFKRGESSQITVLNNGGYETSIRFANLSADNAKWLALYIQGASKPWYVWKITALDHATTPGIILKDFGTIEEFIEGKPIHIKLDLKDEMLLSLEDLNIQFTNNQGSKYLEQMIDELNDNHLPEDALSTMGWPTDNTWRFAIRYHAKVTFENYPDAYEDIRKRDMEPDPDPKTIYAISDPVYWFDGSAPQHSWQRYDSETGEKINWNNDFVSNDMLYFFGIPDRQIQSLNRPEYITDIAHMDVHLYPEIVVVHRDDPDEILYVSDAALGAGNRYILETANGYKQYNIQFTAKNAKDDLGSSNVQIFPIYADNTSPEITLTYGPENEKKYFADRRPEDLVTNDAYDRIAPPMFFVDSVNLKAGQTLRIDAKDNIALYDFAVFFASDRVDQSAWNWRLNLPAIMNPSLETVNLPMGYDFLYKAEDEFYTGQKLISEKNKEDKPTKTLNEILINEPDPVIAKALYTQIYAKTLPGNIYGNFSIDNRFEIYENYTWSGVRNARETAVIDVVKQEQYFTRMTAQVTKEINMPSVPGTYWVWIIARDRGAQDSWLFDYENSRVNIDPLTGEPEIYAQNVLYNQSNYFTVDPNLENVEIYYENSESEADAPTAILLRVNVESHSMDIQRLDIHEPCLVSYPSTDTFGEVWFAHSYNVLQLDDETKVAEFDEGESREHLPRDMYPVFKRQAEDHDAGNQFGLTAAGNVMSDNLWGAIETEYYGAYDRKGEEDTKEAVPVVGGQNPTTFRVKTHEDIEKITLELVDKKVWTVEEYSAIVSTKLDTITIVKDDESSEYDGQGQGGYWEWELDLSSYPGFENVETYCSIIAKAYNNKTGQFYEQWQWPIFVDTKGPDIRMFRMESVEGENKDETHYDHLKVDKIVAPSLLICCPSTVERWVGFEVRDGGGLMFEYEKGFAHSVGPNGDFLPSTVQDLRLDRRYDLCSDSLEQENVCETFMGHKVSLSANDSYYRLFQTQNINNSLYTRHLGFPGNHPSVSTYEDPVSSLKYLTRPVREYEDLELTAPWHGYYTDLQWGNYDGSLWRRDPREITEYAFFNNIDLENGLWEANDKITMKKLEFSLRDELGNTGEWNSYLTRKGIVNLDEAAAEAEGNCRGGLLTVSATANLVDQNEEKVKSIRVVEQQNPAIYEVLESGVTKEIPVINRARFVQADFYKKDVFVPAFQVDRKIQVIVNTENDTEMARTIDLPATYAGAVPVLEIDVQKLLDGGNIRSLRNDLIASGDEDMILLLRSFEDYYLANFDYPKDQYDDADYRHVISTDFWSNDDNVDKYEVTYGLIAVDEITGTLNFQIDNNMNARGEFEDTVNLELDFGLQSPPDNQKGIIIAEIAARDCANTLGNDVFDMMQIMYQNPYTFVHELYPVQVTTEGASSVLGLTEEPTESIAGIANGIYMKLQSDILFRDEQELKSKFIFTRNGITFENFEIFPKIEIDGKDEREFRKVSETYLPNRANEFVIRVSPYNAALTGMRTIEGTKNGFTYSLRNLRTIAAGIIDIIIGGNKPPTEPQELQRNGRTLSWKESRDPEGSYIRYSVYLWEKNEEDPKLLTDNLVQPYYNHLNDFNPAKTYKWYVVATDDKGNKSYSKIHTFGLEVFHLTTTAIPPEGGVAEGEGDYAEGDVIPLTAQPADGFLFDHWEADAGFIANPAAAQTTFIMPGQDAEVTAFFVEETPPWYVDSFMYFLVEIDMFDLIVYEFGLSANPAANVASLAFETLPVGTNDPEPMTLDVVDDEAYTNSLRLDSDAQQLVVYARDGEDHLIGDPHIINLDEIYAFNVVNWDCIYQDLLNLKTCNVEIEIKSDQIAQFVFTPNVGDPVIIPVNPGDTEIATEVIFEGDTDEVELIAENKAGDQLGNAYTKSSM